ncbi:MAG TPA: hypothetical protein VKA02_14590 [Candidatus Acidoferrum sp.]|nr:hypothetical protein [Candidatus Acidoferrum sp.]HYW36571.1 hypothetical protein [Terriglobales bacterium]
MKQKSSSTRFSIKHFATAAVMLSFGVAAVYAQPGQVNITLSGTAAASTISLRPNAPTAEYLLAGNGALGQFDLRAVSVSIPAPQPPSTCSGPNKVYGSAVAGGGVFRFADGSLLNVYLTGGGDCVDFSAGQALCTRILQITGGTGRFRNASGGTVTLTMTVVPVLGDASNNPVFFAVTGTVTGTVPGGARDEGNQDK